MKHARLILLPLQGTSTLNGLTPGLKPWAETWSPFRGEICTVSLMLTRCAAPDARERIPGVLHAWTAPHAGARPPALRSRKRATRVRAAKVLLRIPPHQNAHPTPEAGPLSVYAAILRATARGIFRFREANPPVRLSFAQNQQIGF